MTDQKLCYTPSRIWGKFREQHIACILPYYHADDEQKATINQPAPKTTTIRAGILVCLFISCSFLETLQIISLRQAPTKWGIISCCFNKNLNPTHNIVKSCTSKGKSSQIRDSVLRFSAPSSSLEKCCRVSWSREDLHSHFVARAGTRSPETEPLPGHVPLIVWRAFNSKWRERVAEHRGNHTAHFICEKHTESLQVRPITAIISQRDKHTEREKREVEVTEREKEKERIRERGRENEKIRGRVRDRKRKKERKRLRESYLSICFVCLLVHLSLCSVLLVSGSEPYSVIKL